MSLRDALLPVLDTIRSIAGIPAIGIRPYTVKIRVRVWSGSRPGVGSYQDTDTVLSNTITLSGVLTTVPVRVRPVSTKDVIASGGLYTDHDFRVGPMTPQFATGGYTGAQLDPVPTGAATEIIWLMSGPDIPSNSVFAKIGEEGTALHYYVTLRQQGQVMP